jgi:hypothetical protein
MAVELALGLEARFGIRLPVMLLNEAPTAEKVAQRIVERLLGPAEDTEAAAGTVDALTRSLAQQHGEAASADQLRQVAADAQALQQQGARLSA